MTFRDKNAKIRIHLLKMYNKMRVDIGHIGIMIYSNMSKMYNLVMLNRGEKREYRGHCVNRRTKRHQLYQICS